MDIDQIVDTLKLQDQNINLLFNVSNSLLAENKGLLNYVSDQFCWISTMLFLLCLAIIFMSLYIAFLEKEIQKMKERCAETEPLLGILT